MQEDQQESSLSISQRGYLIAKSLREKNRNLFYLLIGMIGYTWFGTWYVFSYPEETVFPQYWLSLTAIVFSVYTIRHFISGRRIGRRVEDWNEDYLEQSYILVFNTSIPKGETTAERIVTLASSIFPQLRSDYKDLSFGYTDRIKLYFKRKFRISETSSDLSKYIDRAVGFGKTLKCIK
jgi:hypothetical protein